MDEINNVVTRFIRSNQVPCSTVTSSPLLNNQMALPQVHQQHNTMAPVQQQHPPPMPPMMLMPHLVRMDEHLNYDGQHDISYTNL